MADQPVIADGVRLGELVAIFALGQDNAFGQPLESQMRSTLLAAWLAESMGLPADVRDVVYWVGQLRYIGCTGHAHEVAVLFGDEIETRARTLLYDASSPAEVLRDVLGHALPERRGLSRIGAVVSLLAGGRTFADMNFRTGCEVADVIAGRLGVPATVREALACTFERWNGKGQPNGVTGEQIPPGMRMVHLTHDMEALARLRSPAAAALAARRRSGSAYDPALVTGFLGVADELFDRLGKLDPWDEVVALEPAPHRMLRGESLDTALEVAADFIDPKSPYTAGHSRGVAGLAASAAERIGLTQDEIVAARRAGLVHDLGRTAIPNSIWDKPGPLTRAESRPRTAPPAAHRADAPQIARPGTPETGRRLPSRASRRLQIRQRAHRQPLAQDSRHPHPAHLHQDRRIHARRGSAVRHAAPPAAVTVVLKVTGGAAMPAGGSAALRDRLSNDRHAGGTGGSRQLVVSAFSSAGRHFHGDGAAAARAGEADRAHGTPAGRQSDLTSRS